MRHLDSLTKKGYFLLMESEINEIRKSFEAMCKNTGFPPEVVKADYFNQIDNLEWFDSFFEIPASQIPDEAKEARKQILINALLY